MKRIVSLLLILVLCMGLFSCRINKEEIHVIWSDLGDDYLATIADAVDRAMYIKNIRYRHVDSEGSAQKQLEQVDAALATGSGIVVVSAVNASTSAAIVEKARGKDAVVVFICCDVAETVMTSYDKAYYIDADSVSVIEVLGDRIAEDLIANYESYDRNNDGKISYIPVSVSYELSGTVEYVNGKLESEDRPALELHPGSAAELLGSNLTEVFRSSNDVPELLLVGEDDEVVSVLLALRADGLDYNYTKLKTHFIPFYTVGIAANAGDLIPDKKEEERAAYSVMNAIDNGFVSAAALENDDEIAISLCSLLANFIKEKDTFRGIDESYISGNRIFVPYTIYG